MAIKYNKTQLNPDLAFERHVYHRDMFCHYLRWSHVLKIAKIGQRILDFGCGSGNLAEVFYRNRFKPERYLGLDIRKKIIDKNKEKFKNIAWANFMVEDLCNLSKIYRGLWDLIISFEVLEHVGKENGNIFIENIVKHMNVDSICLLSTPVFDENVGAAKNHIINGKIGEYTFDECKKLITKYFIIEKVYGTFASKKDYLNELRKNENLHDLYLQLNEYYDSNIISVMFAPLFPSMSRNCIWRCRLK